MMNPLIATLSAARAAGPMSAFNAAVPAPAADVDAELAAVQAQLAATNQQLDRVQLTHDHHVKEASDLVHRCNEIADQVQPLYARESKLYRAKKIACYTGLAGAGMLGLGPGLMNISPQIGLAVLLADVALLGASYLVVEGTKKRIDRIAPEANALGRQWKALKSRLDATERDARSTRTDISRLESTLKAQRGQEEVLLIARGVTHVPKPDETIRTEDDSVMIGTLRIPRRSAAAEKEARA